MLYLSDIKDAAFSDLDLLTEVALFKKKFYKSNRSRYEEATKDELKLLPSKENIKELLVDYDRMQSMIFGKKILFDQILEGLARMIKELRMK
jgi:hypothetical protein